MACRSRGVDLHEERVGITVEAKLHEVQHIPAGLPFLPETVAGAAVEVHLTCAERRLHGLAIHVGEHEHGARRGILYDRGQQAGATQAAATNHAASALGRTRTPHAATARLRSDTTTPPGRKE